jgi:hypothetical protein
MRFRLTWPSVLPCVALAGVATAFAVADSDTGASNPYAVIGQSNVFHLNPIPPPPPADDAKPADLPKVMFSGIMKVGNNVKVLLAIPSKDNKEPPAYLSLNEGEKGGDGKGNEVEIVRIRPEKEEVDIINSGTRQTLTIASNGYVASAAPAAPAKPGAPAMPGMPGIPNRHIPMPGGMQNPAAPTAAAAPPTAAGSRGGSAIIAGSGGYGNGSAQSYGGQNYGGGAIVAGGSQSTGVVMGGGSEPAAAAPNPIASALLNPASQYRMPPAPTAVPPAEVQAANLLIHKTAFPDAPPLPPGLEQAAEGETQN